MRFDETSLVVEGQMLDRAGRQLKALAWFEFVYVSLVNGRPASHGPELVQIFRSVALAEEFDPNGFNRRVESVRRRTRRPADAVPAGDAESGPLAG
jgi:hypothetical protein